MKLSRQNHGEVGSMQTNNTALERLTHRVENIVVKLSSLV